MRLLLSLFALLVFTLDIQAQGNFVFGTNDKLVTSLENVLYVVRQEYALRGPDGELYGSDNRDYFGYTYGPALMINGQLLLSRYTYQPYLRDTSFRSFGENFLPEPTKTYFKKVKGTEFQLLMTEPKYSPEFSIFIPVPDSASVKHTFSFNPGSSSNCIVVTFITREEELTRNTTYNYNFVNNKVTWEADNTGKLEDQSLGISTRFGLLFYEHREPGNAALVLGGFVEKNPEGKWVVIKITDLNPAPVTGPETEADQQRDRRFRLW